MSGIILEQMSEGLIYLSAIYRLYRLFHEIPAHQITGKSCFQGNLSERFSRARRSQ